MSVEFNNMNMYNDNSTAYEYEDQNMETPTGVTTRSRARTLAIESFEARLVNNNRSLPASPLSEPRQALNMWEDESQVISNDYFEPPDWLGENITSNHPDWTNEDVRYYLDSLWNELSTEEQREFTSQGTEIVNDEFHEQEEVLDSGVVGENNLYPFPAFIFNTVINNIPLPPPPPPPKIVPDSHPDGDDEIGIEGLTCVVCMENKVKIFPRCGHVCACIKCSKGICLNSGRCPLCREYWCDLRMMYFP